MVRYDSSIVICCCRIALILLYVGDTNRGLTPAIAAATTSLEGSTCISGFDGIGECRGPTEAVVSRGDKAAYLRALYSDEEAIDYDEDARKEEQRPTQQSKMPLADPIGCRLYLAPSSIPNAGLGVYAGTEVPKFSPIGNPDIAIGIFGADQGHFSATLLSSYTWATWTIRMHFESKPAEGKSSHALVPGIGMLSNCHLGLINANIFPKDSPVHQRANFQRNKDPGLGAVSDYDNVAFQASQHIPRGAEIFVDYGDKWFSGRETSLGVLVPFLDNFVEADTVILDFLKSGDDLLSRRVEWQSILDNYSKHHQKTYSVLPKDVTALAQAAEIGAARYSSPDSIRSIEWLEQNGHCVNTLRVGYSTIPQAGRGSFATRFLSKGYVIASSPLVPVDRETLNGSVPKAGEHTQLLQNYCFGHGNSSLFFFPNSASISYINHNSRPNARVQWSGQVERLNESLTQLKSRRYPGLMIDIVATRDIGLGEEVLIDYGPDWEAAWREHLEQWTPRTDQQIRLSVAALNEDVVSPIRTIHEMEKDSGIQTICLYNPSSPTYKFEFHLKFDLRHWRPCDIWSRTRVSGAYLYTAHMRNYDDMPPDAKVSDTAFVIDIPRWAIAFTEEAYSSGQHIRTSFRKEIGFSPKSLFPSAWLDLS